MIRRHPLLVAFVLWIVALGITAVVQLPMALSAACCEWIPTGDGLDFDINLAGYSRQVWAASDAALYATMVATTLNSLAGLAIYSLVAHRTGRGAALATLAGLILFLSVGYAALRQYLTNLAEGPGYVAEWVGVVSVAGVCAVSAPALAGLIVRLVRSGSAEPAALPGVGVAPESTESPAL